MIARFLLLLLFLVFCTKSSADVVQQAATRIDDALVRDFDAGVAQEQKRFHVHQLPVIPPITDDASFLRRTCIDLAGRLPTADEVRAFTADSTFGKRARLVDALLQEPGAVEVRFRLLAEAFRVNDDDPAAVAWLRRAAAEDLPFDQIVTWWVGEGHVQRRDGGDALRTGTEVALTLFGENLYCAMCHDHPYNDHTQMECYRFAAYFAREDAPLRLPKDYRYKDGKPGELVEPQTISLEKERSPRMQRGDVVRWLADARHDVFVLKAARRVWRQMFGQPREFVDRSTGGVTEAAPWHDVHPKPFNQRTSSNCFSPSPHQPTTLQNELEGAAAQALMTEFRRGGLRLGRLQRILASTTAYSREAIRYDTAWSVSVLVPAPCIRRLPSEVVWSTLSGEKENAWPQVPPREHALRLLGRGTREWEDESCTPVSHELVRFMLNGDAVAQRANASAGQVEDLFLQLLGRPAQPHEQAAIAREAASAPDVAWALLNTAEFMFTH